MRNSNSFGICENVDREKLIMLSNEYIDNKICKISMESYIDNSDLSNIKVKVLSLLDLLKLIPIGARSGNSIKYIKDPSEVNMFEAFSGIGNFLVSDSDYYLNCLEILKASFKDGSIVESPLNSYFYFYLNLISRNYKLADKSNPCFNKMLNSLIGDIGCGLSGKDLFAQNTLKKDIEKLIDMLFRVTSYFISDNYSVNICDYDMENFLSESKSKVSSFEQYLEKNADGKFKNPSTIFPTDYNHVRLITRIMDVLHNEFSYNTFISFSLHEGFPSFSLEHTERGKETYIYFNGSKVTVLGSTIEDNCIYDRVKNTIEDIDISFIYE